MIVYPPAPCLPLNGCPMEGGKGGPGPTDEHPAPINHRSLAQSQDAGPCSSHPTPRPRRARPLQLPPPPGLRHCVDHQEEGGVALGLPWSLASIQCHHHRSITDQYPALAAHGYWPRASRPSSPADPPPAPSAVPLFRPPEANPERGLLPPPVSICPVRKFFQKIS